MTPQPVSTPTVSIDSIKIDSLENILYSNVSKQLSNEYVEILKEVNSQLSMTLNPWSVTFSAMAVMLGILSIVAAYVIWRQGSDFKAQRNALIKEAKNSFNALSTKHNKEIQVFTERTKKLEEAAETRLKSLESKLHIAQEKNDQKEIEELETKIKQTKRKLKEARYDTSICPRCGYTFNLPNHRIARRRKDFKEVIGHYCPNCDFQLYQTPIENT